MRPIFYYHVPATDITDNICHFIFYFYFFQIFLCRFYRLIKIRVEITHHCFPVYIAFLNSIQQRFHICSKMFIYNTWK